MCTNETEIIHKHSEDLEIQKSFNKLDTYPTPHSKLSK